MTLPETNYHVRWMIRRDMADVLQIARENHEVLREEEDFLKCLRSRNCIGMVAEVGEKIVGYMVYELHSKKLEILSLAEFAGTGARGVLYKKLMSKLSSHRRTRICWDVLESNLKIQKELRDFGFKAVRVLRNYSQNTEEDAFRFVFRLENEAKADKKVMIERNSVDFP